MILSFGLLGPGKGYEAVIAAMPAVAAVPRALRDPRRHAPRPAAHEGEAYRSRLETTAEALDVTDHVRFVHRFVGRDRARDVARGGGHLRDALSRTSTRSCRAPCPTPWAPARRWCPPRTPTPASVSPAAAGGWWRRARRRRSPTRSCGCSGPRGTRGDGRRAYAYSRGMTWPAVGAEYAAIFAGSADGPCRRGDRPPTSLSSVAERPLYPVTARTWRRSRARWGSGSTPSERPGPGVRVLHGRRRTGAARRSRAREGARLGRGGGRAPGARCGSSARRSTRRSGVSGTSGVRTAAGPGASPPRTARDARC